MISGINLTQTSLSCQKPVAKRQNIASNVTFQGGEFSKFTKKTVQNAAEGIYKASVKAAVKGYNKVKDAVNNFDTKKAGESIKETAQKIPGKVKNFANRVKELTKEAINDLNNVK